jgi:NAD(P)-dependent dehydrogenase (short-subunit alcohol dehydrogenase family)
VNGRGGAGAIPLPGARSTPVPPQGSARRPPARWPPTVTASRRWGAAPTHPLTADKLGRAAIAIEADVADRASIVAAADRAQRELSGADILDNNAGVMLLGPSSPSSPKAPTHDRDHSRRATDWRV